ncbi:MAG: 5'/3'-nucleotidase SurE [Planctomycetota bacterium]
MRILVTNDDGVHAPGLAALANQLRHLGDVTIIAPSTEQSGVGHSITYLTPLVCKPVFRDGHQFATAVDGSPADCVKLAVTQLLDPRPDLIVSGINSGLNAGINVLYSGTVAAAIEGAFFGITSIAVSLEYSEDSDFESAAVIARNVISEIHEKRDNHEGVVRGGLFNLNIPTAATQHASKIVVAPMGLAQYGNRYEARKDPGGRPYYWALWNEPEKPPAEETDVTLLQHGHVTLTPLSFDMTRHNAIEEMRRWNLQT